jgi:hypothetical protein
MIDIEGKTTMSRRNLGGIALVTMVSLAACEQKASPPTTATGAPAATTRAEDPWGFSLTAPSGWTDGDKSTFKVPGDLRYAFVPPGYPKTSQASITVFLQKAGQPFTARKLLDTSVEGMKKASADATVQEVRTIAGMKSMWMEVAGAGSGGAMGAGGAIRTSQVWAAIPRGNDVLVLLFTTPEAAAAAQRPAFESLVKSLTITGSQTEEQKASK